LAPFHRSTPFSQRYKKTANHPITNVPNYPLLLPSSALLALLRRQRSNVTKKFFNPQVRFMLLGHAGFMVFDHAQQLIAAEFPRLLNVDTVLMLSTAFKQK
jgi:hypothetical protein